MALQAALDLPLFRQRHRGRGLAWNAGPSGHDFFFFFFCRNSFAGRPSSRPRPLHSAENEKSRHCNTTSNPAAAPSQSPLHPKVGPEDGVLPKDAVGFPRATRRRRKRTFQQSSCCGRLEAEAATPEEKTVLVFKSAGAG